MSQFIEDLLCGILAMALAVILAKSQMSKLRISSHII